MQAGDQPARHLGRFVVGEGARITHRQQRVKLALRGRPGPDRDDPFVASRMYAPAGLIPTRAERELEKEWAAFDAARPRGGAGGSSGAGTDAGAGADR